MTQVRNAGGAVRTINTKNGKSLLLAATTAASLLLIPRSYGGTDTWVGNTSTAWNAANWSGTNNPPLTNDALIFNAAGTAGGNLNDNLTSSSFNISSITFGATAPAYNISGNAFTLTGGITDNSAAAQTINDPFTLGANQAFYASTAAGILNLNGNISGTGITLTTNGGTGGNIATSNTIFTGTVSLASLVAQGNQNSTATYANNQTTTFNNATLSTTGNVVVGRSNLVFEGSTVANIGGILGNVGASSIDWANITIQNSASVTTVGLNMSGNNTTGAANLNGGILTTGYISGIDREGGGAARITFNGTQVVASSANANFVTVLAGNGGAAQAFVGNGGAIFNSSGFNIGSATNFVNGTGATGSLTKLGAGTLTLTGSLTYTGTTTVNGGTLLLTGALNAGPNLHTNSAVIINNGGTISVVGDNNYLTGNPGAVPTTINAGGTLTIAANTSTAHISVLNLSGGTLASTGTLGGDGATYGAWNLDKGVIAGGNATTSTISASGVALTETGGTIFNVSAGATSGTDLNVTGTFLHATGSGDTGLIKTGNGVMTLAGVNTYTGPTNVSAGTLNIASTGSIVTTSVVSVGGTLNLGATTTFVSLSGPSTGVTNLNGNNLTLTNGGVYAGSIANGTATGGRLNVSGGTFVLTGTAGVAGGVISSSNLSLQDGAVNTASIGGTLVLNASALSFDLGTGTADKLTVGGAASFNGTDAINLDLIAGQTITSGNYTLMTTGGGLTPGGSNFTLGTKPAGFNTYNFSNSTSTSLVLSITANAAVVGADYWTGLASSTGSPTDANNYWGYGASLGTPMSNWSTTSNGLTDPLQVPGSQSDVIFTASNATPTAGSILVTTLDGSYAIDSLTFAGSGSNNITAIGINASGNTLTISGANNGGNGIVLTAASLASGSIGGTTGSLVVVNGSQNWANNNATLPLNVSTGITAFSGATTLTLNGTGAGGVVLGGVIGNGGGTLGLVLNQAGLTQITGSNTFTGGVTINSGTVQLGNASAFNSTTPNTLTFGSASTGDLQLNGNSIAVASLNTNATTPGTTIVENASATAATLTVKATGQNTFAGTVQDGTGGGALSLALSGTGSLNLSGTISTSGSVTVGSGTTLTESGTDTSTGATSVSGGGTIVLAANSSATGGLVIHDGGTLQLVATTANTTAGVSNAAGNRAVNSIQLSDGINTATSNALIQLRSDSTVTFANTATGTATGNTTLTFDVNNITSGVTGNTLSFGALGTFQTVINVTGGNGYIFSLAGVSNGNGSFVTFKPTTANAVVGPISNTSVVTMAGTGTLFLVNDGSGNGSSTTGVYDFASGITNVAGLTDYGTAGPLGARAASQEVPAGNGIGLLFEGGTLQYTGSTPQETNRQIRMSNNATNTIDASGSVPSATVDFSYSGTNTNLFETAGTRTLNLTGTNTGQNIFAISLTDQGTNPTSLTKSGAGTWVLTGSSTYSGATSIKAGTLALNSSGAVLTNSSLINVSSGAIFDISANPTFVLAPTATLAGNGTVNGFYNHSAGTLSPGGTGTIGTLTFNNDLTFSGGILRLDLNGSSTTVGSGVNDLVAVNGNLNLSAGTTTTLTVVATPTPAINSIYKVITYTGALNTDGLPHLVAPNRAYSVITSVPGAIELEYTGGAAGNLVWNSASNQNWDTTTANWYNTGTLAIDRYFSGDNVAFNDSTGSPVTAPQTTINLTSTMLPSSVTVNTNIVNYTFAGNGSIGGTATLTMNGSSLLTISTANPYSGDTSVNAGTVLVTGTTGAGLGTGNLNISSGATVQVGNGTATPVPTNISINDNGALTFNSSTGMTLAMIISGSGTLNQLGTNQLFINVANSYGGGTNIVSGSIQTQNNLALGTGLVTINGGQLYATQSGGTNFTNAFNLSSPTPTAALQAGGGGVTTISGPVTLIGNTVLQIDGGSTIGFLDTPTAVSGANFNLVVNGDGGSSFALGGSTNLGTGTISVGANTVLKFEPPTATTITIPNSIIAAGGVQQTGLGTTILSVSNSYTGGTQVVSGVLEVTNSNALGNSSGVSINGGNPLPVTTANLSLSSGITLSQNFTLGGRAGASATTPEIVNLDSANTLTGTIATATGGNNYIVESDGGTLTLTGSFAPNGPTGVRFLDLQGTASGVWSGAITDGTAVVTVTKSGTGTWNLSSGNSYSGGTVINAGLLVAASGVSSLGSGLTTVNGGGVIFTDTPANAIFPMLQSGFNGGAWNGTTGITSTAAAGDTTHLHAVGFLQPTSATTFEGQSLATSDVAVKYTYYGDANLDGKVDGSDYSLIDNGYLQGLTGWQNGDFNYDGVVDGSDYTLIDNAFNSQGVQISAEVASATAQIAGAGASSAVPEPASLGFLGIAAVGLLGRKGRRHSDW